MRSCTVLSLVLFWCVLTNICNGKIVVVDSFSAIPELVSLPKENKGDVLYVFDVDETLITYKDSVLRERNRESIEGQQLQAYFNANCKKPNDAQYGEYIWSQIFLQAKKILIEPEVKNIISSLQKNGFPVIALTRLFTGKYGTISSLQEWRYAQLLSLGIDFSKSSPLKDLTFTELKSKEGKHPIFFKGILLTDTFSKRETLEAFLNEFRCVKGFLPRKIIYIEDTFSYLEEVQDLCQYLGIEFAGYHYLGTQSLPGDFNLELAKKQIDYLILHESWLNF